MYLFGYGFVTFVMHDVTSHNTWKNVQNDPRTLNFGDIFHDQFIREPVPLYNKSKSFSYVF